MREFAKEYQRRFGREPNFHGEAGYTAANVVLLALDRAGWDLTVDGFIAAMESIQNYKDIFGAELSFGPNQHHGSVKSYLSFVQERALGAGDAAGAILLKTNYASLMDIAANLSASRA